MFLEFKVWSYRVTCTLMLTAALFTIAKVLVAQLCPTLCDAMDCNLPRSSVHAISQARILEWAATPFSRGASWPRESGFPELQVDSLPFELPGKPKDGSNSNVSMIKNNRHIKHTYKSMSFLKKEGQPAARYDMEGSWRHYAKGHKLVTKRQIPHDSTYWRKSNQS